MNVADDRIVTLQKPLTVNGRLDLLGGFRQQHGAVAPHEELHRQPLFEHADLMADRRLRHVPPGDLEQPDEVVPLEGLARLLEGPGAGGEGGVAGLSEAFVDWKCDGAMNAECFVVVAAAFLALFVRLCCMALRLAIGLR